MYAAAANYSKTRKLTVLASLTAISYVLWVIGRVPVVAFLRYDPKDVVIVFAGFLFGPMAAFLISGIVSFLQMVTLSETGPIGFFMNVVSTVAFACTAAYIYQKRQTIQGAVIGLACGILLSTASMLLWNYIVTPAFMGIPREAVAAMLIPVFLPFNLIKGGLNATLALLLYKPLIRALRASRLIPEREESGEAAAQKWNIGVLLAAGLVLVSLIMVVMALQGVI
ncbi:MAG: ECF transporter S component [Oscillospiraceae bacterium]|nr:ECF transporter S component [Oscillospiraceae bacterium]